KITKGTKKSKFPFRILFVFFVPLVVTAVSWFRLFFLRGERFFIADGATPRSAGGGRALARHEQAQCTEHHIAERHQRRYHPAELRPVYQADEGERGADERRPRGVGELAVDDERGGGAQHHSGKHRTAAEHGYALVDDADLPQRGETELVGAAAGHAERVVDVDLRPLRDVRDDRQHHRGRVVRGARLECLRADDQPDGEEDGQDRHQRDHVEQQRGE